MAKLTPVDFDPFAAGEGGSGTTARLVPVDFDPFAPLPEVTVEGLPIEPAMEADPAEVGKIRAEMAAKRMPPPPAPEALPLAVNQPPLTGAAANVPLPPERFVPTGDTTLPPVQGLEEAPIRTGGGFFDAISGVGAGMLSPQESVRQTQERIAAAEAGAQQAQAVRPGIEARELETLRSFKNKEGTPIVDIVQNLASQRDIAAESGQFDYARQLQVQMNNVIANSPIEFRQILAQKKLDITESAEAKARAEQAQAAATKAKLAPAVTQTALRSGAETAGETLGGLGADLVGGAQRVVTSPISLIEAVTGQEPNMSRAVDKSSKALHDAMTGGFRPDPAQMDDLGMKLTSGIASSAGFIATGAVGRGLKLSQAAGTAIAGALPQAEQNWKEAERRAKEDPSVNQQWRRWASFSAGLGIGGLEALPVGMLFEKLEKASGGGLSRLLGITAANFGEESVQEVTSQILNNANSIAILKDPNVTLDKGVADAIIIGGLSGAIVGGGIAVPSVLKQNIQQMRDVYKTPDAAPPELRPLLFPELSTQASGTFGQQPNIQYGQPAPAAPSSPVAPVEAQGPEGVLPSPSASAAPENEPARPVIPVEQAELLKGDGFTVEDIIDMSPEELEARVEEAVDNQSQRVPLTAEEQQQLAPAKPKAPSEKATELVEQGVPPLQAMQEAAQEPVSTKIPPEKIKQFEQEAEQEWTDLTGEAPAQPEQAAAPVAESEPVVEAEVQMPERVVPDVLPEEKGGNLTEPTSESPVTTQEVAENAAPAGEQDNVDKLSEAFKPRLAGEGFKNINDARKVAKETVGSEDPKLIEEAMELSVVRRAREIVDEGKGTQETYDDLVKLYERQPNLSTRTSTSVLQQAYSTPVPLAYVASRLAGVNKGETVLEPTAGNGALLIESDFGKAYANELNAVRRRNLEKQGYKPTGLDAALADQLTPDKKADVIITNPPFGAIKDEQGNSKVFDLTFALKGTLLEGGKYTTKEIDHAIALKSLEEMKPDGRAVLIVGSVNPQIKKREDGYNGKAKRDFYFALYNKYKVKDHFTVSGDLYTKQGASWPVDVIVIEGRGRTENIAAVLPAVKAPEMITSWEQLGEKLKNEYRATAGEAVSAPIEAPEPDTGGRPRGGEGGVNEPAVGGGTAGLPASAGRPEQRVPAKGDKGKPAPKEPAPSPVSPERPTGGEPVGLSVKPPAGGVKPSIFANNKIFTEDKYEAARKAIRDKLRTQLNAGFDPEFMMHGLTIAGTYIEAGIRKFKDFVKAMIEDFGEAIKPYLLNFYESVRTYPGIDTEGMTSREDVAAQHNEIMRGSNVIENTVVDTPAIKQEMFEQIEGERQAPKKMEQVTELQLPYEPASKLGEGLGTLIPINMKTAAEDALRKLEQKRGSIDAFVANRLDYPVSDIGKYFSAEQIDAIALTLDNLEKGSGFIIGDQTGIGKGRINAAIIRYALINKKIPIFITVKANLYSDMWRDMKAIGLDKYLGRNPKVFMTDNKKKVPLDEIGPDGKELKLISGNQLKNIQKFTKDANIGDNDVVFTTYSQMQPQGDNKGNPRHPFLSAIAPKAILIMDESHNAGGSGEQDDKMTSAKFARGLIEMSQGVFYSSATYAKRPNVMDLYSKTDMRLAVSDIADLGDLIARGGVPLMQINASMLAEAGQMLRRERSFAGVTYDTETAQVDKKTYNDFSQSINQINQFSKAIKKITMGISEKLKGQGQIATGGEGAAGAGAESTNFTSVMHNLISQMLLAMKAQPAVTEAIRAIENGEKPVLTVANTMESFITDQMEELGLKKGDKIDMDFADLLLRYLEKQRYIYVTKPFGEKEKIYLTDEDLGPEGLAQYNAIRSLIRSKDFSGLVISPIDYIKDQLRSRGYSIGEITGREYGVTYEGNYPVISQRDPNEISIEGRAKTIKGFNNGTIDAMILNQAGSTGISLHASKDFKDQRPRKMILVQPEANVDVHMQMLGRVHRTGQVVLPSYIQLIADIPAEKRPAAILAKKMASLAASTTASRKGGLSSEQILDFMNEYGDQIVGEMLVNDEELQNELDILLSGKEASAIKEGKGGTLDDLIRKFTGRLTLLPLDRQEQVYEELEGRYRELIAFEDAQGTNKLEAKNVDLEAKLLEKRVVKEKEGDSPFTGAVEYGLYDVKRQNKPITIRAALDKLIESQKAEGTILPEDDVKALVAVSNMFKQRQDQKYGEARKAFNTYKKEILDDTDTDDFEKQQTKLNATLDAFDEYAKIIYPGARLRVFTPTGESYVSLILDVKNKGKTKNPLALGDWSVTLANPSGVAVLSAPFSMLQVAGEIGQNTVINSPYGSDTVESTVDIFNTMAKLSREKRVIVTGNLLSAFDMLSGKGQILNFTTETGEIRPGIMLAANVKSLDDAVGASKTTLKNAQEIREAIKRGRKPEITSAKNDISIRLERDGSLLTITVPGNKAKGGKYFLNQDLIKLLGRDFSGKKIMAVTISGRSPNVDAIFDKIISLGAKFETEAKNIVERRASYGLPQAEVRQGQRQIDDIKSGIEEIANRVFGNLATVETPEYIQPSDIDIEYARKSGYTGPAEDLPAPKGFAEIDSVGALRFVVATMAQGGNTSFTAYHEADHILELADAYTPRERRIREASIPRMREVLIENGFAPKSVAQMSNSEILANAFAIYSLYADIGRDTFSPFPGGLRGLFDKVRRFIDLFRNWLQGNGFSNIESLMRNQYVGNLAKRAQAQLKQQTAQQNRRVQATKQYSFSEAAIQKMEMLNAMTGGAKPSKPTVASSFTTPKVTFSVKASEKLADRLNYQVDVQNAIEEARGGPLPDGLNPYLIMSTMTPRISERLEFLRKREVDPIIKLIKKLKLTADEVGMYLIAKHAKERNDEIRKISPKDNAGSGLTDDAAKTLLDEFDNAGKTKALEQVAQKVYDMIKADRERRLRAGLLDQKTIDEWDKKYKNYVPLRGYGEFDIDEDTIAEKRLSTNIGRGISVSKRESLAALGRKGIISGNPLTMAIMQAEEGIYRVEKNRAAVALLKLARQYPNPDLWTVDKFPMKRVLGKDGIVKLVPDIPARYGENVVIAKSGGKVQFVELHNKMLAQAFKNMGVEAMAEPLRKMNEVMRFYAKLHTSRNPNFFYPNLTRSFQSGLLTTFVNRPRLAAQYLKEYFPSLIYAVRMQFGYESKETEAWKKSGGKISYNVKAELETISRQIEDMVGDVDPVKWSNLPMKTKRAFVKLMQRAFAVIDSLSEPMDNAARLAAFQAAQNLGYSDLKSADIALEADTNFTRKGTWNPVTNFLWMFYNASTQGGLQPWRWRKNKRFMAAYIGMVPMAVAITMMNLAMSDDDEAEKGLKNYTNIPDYVRMRNIVIKYGPGKTDYFRIPLMFGLQVPYLIGENITLVMTGQITIEQAAANTIVGIINTYNPLGYGSPLSVLAPTLVDPFVDIAMNERAASRAPIYPKETEFREGIPQSEQYFASTPDWAVSMSQFLNDMGIASVDMYPGTIQYMLEKFTAGTGGFVGGISNWAENTFSGIETPMSEIPVVKSFLPVADRESNRYYDARSEILGDVNNLRDKVKKLESNPTDRKLLDEINELSIKTGGTPRKDEITWSKDSPYKTIQRVDEEISELRKIIMRTRNNPNLSPLQKQEKIQKNEETIRRLMVTARRVTSEKEYSGPLSQFINRE